MVVLRGKGVALRDADLVTADNTTINAGVRGCGPRGYRRVERRVLRLGQMLTMLELSHGGSFSK